MPRLICEVCGATVEIAYEVIYKGSRGFACENCISRYGLIRVRKGSAPPRKVVRPKPTITTRKKSGSGFKMLEEGPEFVDNYGLLIRRAREGMGLTQEQLAKKLGIKLSYLKKIEAGVIPPSIDLAKRIERTLNIKILVDVSDMDEEAAWEEVDREAGYTLGDLMGFDDR